LSGSRLVFLIPDLRTGALERARFAVRQTRLRRIMPPTPLTTTMVHGGTLNIMRHCVAAQAAGAQAVLATASGRNAYGDDMGIAGLDTIRWADRTPEDVCVLPDIYTDRIDQVRGAAVAYLQNPRQVRADFDFRREGVFLWTDSPPMLERCRATYPGAQVEIVPNVVDEEAFPFRSQKERREGELVAFPRKGSSFIDDVYDLYRARGGRYWTLERVDGLAFRAFAARMQSPQAFLASADVEGCALPPQECMAAGVVVLGKDALGANFCMRDGETALVGNSVEEAADAMRRAEDPELRDRLTQSARSWIARYFRDAEPRRFWQAFLARLG